MLSRLLTALPRLKPAASAKSAKSDGTHYLFKPSLAGGAKQFELTDAGLAWRAAKPRLWPLESIAEIRLSYRPVSMQPRRFRMDIVDTSGQRVTLFSTTWRSMSQTVCQDDDYRAFVVELHRRLSKTNHKVRLVAGINPVLFMTGLAAMVLIGLAIFGLLVRALLIGEFAGALFLAGFAAWFTWQIGGFMRRNRPRSYAFDALPQDVLP